MCWTSTTTPTTSPSRASRSTQQPDCIDGRPGVQGHPQHGASLPALRHRRREPAGRPQDRRRCRPRPPDHRDRLRNLDDGLSSTPIKNGWDNVRVGANIWLEPSRGHQWLPRRPGSRRERGRHQDDRWGRARTSRSRTPRSGASATAWTSPTRPRCSSRRTSAPSSADTSTDQRLDCGFEAPPTLGPRAPTFAS